MKNKAFDVYQCVKNFGACPDNILCNLHKCNSSSLCEDLSTKVMLNFDDVKHLWCKQNKTKKELSSADGLLYNDYGILCYVEAKTWQLYVKNQRPTNAEDVAGQVGRYDFQKKLLESLFITKGILKDRGVKVKLPIIYCVVTDAPEQNDIAAPLSDMLNYLANTASDLYITYGNEIKNKLSQITDVDCHYIKDCRYFDSEMKNLKYAREILLYEEKCD